MQHQDFSSPRWPLSLASAVSCFALHGLVLLTCGSVVGPASIEGSEPGSSLATSARPDFARDVQPILADHCFVCHGQDEGSREAGLRLDTAAGATTDLGGYQAIVPGDLEASEAWLRISSDDEGMRMPPVDAQMKLTAEEISILRRWIESGAPYQQHWAFQPPHRPTIPAVANAAWAQHPIDRFVLARLEQPGWEPAPPADPYELVQRLYLDLTGLPPTPQQADAFISDRSPDAYPRLVDNLLASPQYAEHWANRWLDLARYADTNGYEKDRPRSVWPYRDWVIEAISRDMPFDQFTIEQLAGDMLPDATRDQRIATGFHRMTMLNEEGGIDPLEYRFYAMVDRVATTGTVWMGLTVGCAQCHTHKYDPITHDDYYSFMALMNNADEPELVVPDDGVTSRSEQLNERIDATEKRLRDQWLPSQKRLCDLLPTSLPSESESPEKDSPVDEVQQAFVSWLREQIEAARAWKTIRPHDLHSTMPRLELREDGSVLASGDVTKRDVYTLTFQRQADDPSITALRLVVLPDPSLPAGGPGMAFYEGRRGDFFLSELRLRESVGPRQLVAATHSYGNISVGSGSAAAANVIDGQTSTGWSTAGREGESHHLVVNLEEPLTGAGEFQVELLFERHFAAALGCFRIDVASHHDTSQATSLPTTLIDSLWGRSLSSIPASLYRPLRDHFLRISPLLEEPRKPLEALQRQLPEQPTTLVMQERPVDHYRDTHRHHRGEYLSPREEVTPGVPDVFPGLVEEASADRLNLARWLVSEKNPLAGRVVANRAWRDFFGYGLVRTAGDFGTQSEPPTHPELLDYLAIETVAQGWSLKRLHREIVMSATYRQTYAVSATKRKQDPENRMLSRGPRYRRNAETIRDSVLKVGGLLTHRLGGPSVRPPQPDAVMSLAYGGGKWHASEGGDRYRRSLYTFKKRTAPFAAYAVFDAPTGENCVARRDRSNTPLQSLTLLNDEMFLAAAHALAAELSQREEPLSSKIEWLFRRILVRPPQPSEREQISEFYRQQYEKLVLAEEPPTGVEAETEAWFLTARALLNVDEFVTR